MESTKVKVQKAYESLKEKSGYSNKMQAPRIVKVVISAGTGSFKDKAKNKTVEDRLRKLAGQAPSERGAKQSIAAFKVRAGDPVGYQITLRGPRMYDFLDRLLNVALPRTKDFRGIPVSGIDEMGNYTFGIREHTIFPETADEDIRDIFGLAVTIVTTAKNRDEAKAFFEHLGLPFRKTAENK